MITTLKIFSLIASMLTSAYVVPAFAASPTVVHVRGTLVGCRILSVVSTSPSDPKASLDVRYKCTGVKDLEPGSNLSPNSQYATALGSLLNALTAKLNSGEPADLIAEEVGFIENGSFQSYTGILVEVR